MDWLPFAPNKPLLKCAENVLVGGGGTMAFIAGNSNTIRDGNYSRTAA